MQSKVDTFITRDQKRIYFYIFGDPSATPIFFFHGYPGTGKQAYLLKNTHFDNRFCLIAVDRPGYGLSDPQPGLTLKKFAEDIHDLSQHLKIEKFICMGVSGGGPFAASVAYYYPEKVLKVGSICGVAPLSPENIRYLNADQKKTFLMKKLLPKSVMTYLVERKFSSFMSQVNNLASSDLLNSRDKLVFQDPEVGQFLLSTFQEALAQGPAGILTDMEIFSRPWGFDVEDIHVPYYLWHGTEDEVVHFQMSNYMKKRLKDVRYKIFEGEGHYSLPFYYKSTILEDLLVK